MKKILLLTLLLPGFAIGSGHHLTGNPRVDLLSARDTAFKSQAESVQVSLDRSRLKSPVLGAALSLLLPGAGEFYAESHLKSAIFFAVEVITVAGYAVYTKQGDNKTDEFQTFADKYWSAVKYAEWINKYGAEYGPSASIRIDSNASLPPWQRVNFADINRWEEGDHPQGGFTHRLPQHGEQQYFELIGKYIQYKFGWSTYNYIGNALGDDDIPQQMKDYAATRGKANDFYYAAGIFAGLIVANHVVSALDAAWAASAYNKILGAEVGFNWREVQKGELDLVTTVSFKVRL